MAAIANIIVVDGETTPVSHTFNPVKISPLETVWRDTLAGVAQVLQPTIKYRQSYDRKSGLTRTKFSVVLPVGETIGAQNAAGYTSAPKMAHAITCNLEFISHDRSVYQNRKNVRALVYNLLANAQILDAIDNVVAPY